MKFNNGYWLLRPGMTAHLAAETMDVRTTESTVSVAALTRPHVDRGSHLNTATISVELSSPAENVVGVSVRHLLQPDPARTHFEVRDTHPTVEIVHDDHAVSLSSGALTAAISAHGPWSLSFGADDRALTSATARSTGSIDDDHDIRHMIQRLELPVGANVYGFGERFTAFVKNGQVVDTWNEDGERPASRRTSRSRSSSRTLASESSSTRPLGSLSRSAVRWSPLSSSPFRATCSTTT